jgi:hypothetical protein
MPVSKALRKALPTVEAERSSRRLVLKQELMRRHWEQSKHNYNQDFVQFIDEKLQELDREKHKL